MEIKAYLKKQDEVVIEDDSQGDALDEEPLIEDMLDVSSVADNSLVATSTENNDINRDQTIDDPTNKDMVISEMSWLKYSKFTSNKQSDTQWLPKIVIVLQFYDLIHPVAKRSTKIQIQQLIVLNQNWTSTTAITI